MRKFIMVLALAGAFFCIGYGVLVFAELHKPDDSCEKWKAWGEAQIQRSNGYDPATGRDSSGVEHTFVC